MARRMAEALRVLYLQLPVLDYHYDYWGANHPLAGGYLAAYARSRGIDHRPIFLPEALSSFASDTALVRGILARRPDVLVATLMLWNVERTLAIVGAVKAARPQVVALAGGPEAALGFGRRFAGHPFDWVCAAGEGEGMFAQMLGLLSVERRASPEKLRQAASGDRGAVPLDQIPSPYLTGVLPLAPDRSIWVETMRGCPFACAFCYYGKSHRSPRQFPEGWLGLHLSWARKRKGSEVYLLDPSFQITPGLEGRLKRIGILNRSRIPLHTEARVEEVTPELASAFAQAGFASIETGLQSIHPAVLRLVRRRADPEAFVRGARLLKQRGIRLEVDILLGLPGDTPEGFLGTVRFLKENDLAQETTVFPLLLLPGTNLRRRARALGLRYQPHPPYQVEATPGFDAESLRQVIDESEQRLGQGVYPLHLPDLTAAPPRGELIGVVEVELRHTRRPGLERAQMQRLAQCPVFLLRLPDPVPWELVQAWGVWQQRNLPTLLPFFGLGVERPFSLRDLLGTLRALHHPDSYRARLWSLAPDDYLRLSYRPFLLSTCPGDPAFWLEAHRLLPVVRLSKTAPWPDRAGALSRLPVLWSTRRVIGRGTLSALLTAFRGREAELLFTSPENARRWAEVGGLPAPPRGLRTERLRIPETEGR